MGIARNDRCARRWSPARRRASGARSPSGWRARAGRRHQRPRRAAVQATVEAFAAQGWQAFAAPGDVTLAADVARMVDAALATHGSLDILVNNAGGVAGVEAAPAVRGVRGGGLARGARPQPDQRVPLLPGGRAAHEGAGLGPHRERGVGVGARRRSCRARRATPTPRRSRACSASRACWPPS